MAGVIVAATSRGLGRSGRWFTYNGRPIYFAAYDTQELAADPTIDYRAALDLFAQYGINKTRIWIYCYWDTTFLQPWPFLDGRYDLEVWNPAYWTRVRDFVVEAQARGIVVEVSVFAPNNIDEATQWTSTKSRPAWNKNFNANGAFSANASGHFSPQFFNLDLPERGGSGRRLRDYQQMLVDKTVAELGSFDNVYIEVCNEFPVQNADIDRVHPWQTEWARRLTSSGRLVAVHAHEYVGDHTKGIQYFWDDPAVDVLDFHFRTTDPKAIASLLHAAQGKGKILQCNEGDNPYTELDDATRQAWGFFMAGGYFALYEDDSSRIGSAGWIAGARRMKALRDIAEAAAFWTLSPVDGSGQSYDRLVTQGPAGLNWRVMANPGVTCVVYFWGSQSAVGVRITIPQGDYSFAWHDARDAKVLRTGQTAGGPGDFVPAPSAADWDANVGVALLVRARA